MTDMQKNTHMRWHHYSDEAGMHGDVVQRITAWARECIAQKKQFSIVLSGGNTPRHLYTLLRAIETDWSCWHIYFGDERCLPANAEGRNDTMAFNAWLSHVPIPIAQIHRIPGELPQQKAAEKYTAILQKTASFDLVLLGIGEDGHTASLFPDHEWGAEKNSPPVLTIDNAPFPPPQRISLSAQRLSHAQQLWYLVSGSKKQRALQRWQKGEYLPMSVITPPNGVDVFVAS